MTPDPETLKHIIDYCDRRWIETDAEPEAAFRTDDGVRTGKKMAYNDVLQYARKLLNGGA
jgi:hypothetical protein